MADELHTPNHRWYEPRNHIPLAKEDVSKQWIYDSGIQKIDAWINSQPWGNPVPGLFALSEPGVWYDPSDLTTMFTDTAGTTQAAVGDAVALVLDKSKGLVLGSELVTNGGFDADVSGWTISSNASFVWSSGGAVYTQNVFPAPVGQTLTTKIGAFYVVTVTVSGISAGSAVRIGFHTSIAASQTQLANTTTPGTFTKTLSASSTTMAVTFDNNVIGASFTIDNISVKELPGFHATQSTTTARPILARIPEGGRRNLLTFTEAFDNAAWVKTQSTVAVTANPQEWYLANDGVNATSIISQAINPPSDAFFTIELKADTLRYVRLRYLNVTNANAVNIDLVAGTSDGLPLVDAGDGFYRVFLGFTSGADNNGIITITLSDTSGGTNITPSTAKRIIMRKPQFELGSTATDYQKVVSTYDVTEAGKADLYHLVFDGTDDWLVTPTITPGTDKAQVFAGVRKLSDAAQAVVAELSTATGLNSGSLALFAPTAPSAATFQFNTRGTAGAAAQATSLAAPITSVLAGISDISGDSVIIRVNGTQAAQSTNDQGTGNYLAYLLYIGRRAGTSLPFNGHLYSLIVRFGANLDAGTIESTEGYVAGKTGVVLP